MRLVWIGEGMSLSVFLIPAAVALGLTKGVTRDGAGFA